MPIQTLPDAYKTSWDVSDARRGGGGALLLNEGFRGHASVAVTEISHSDRNRCMGLKIGQGHWLMPGPNFRAHERVSRQGNRGFFSQPGHDRVQAIGTAVEIRKTLRARCGRIKRIGGNRRWNPPISRAYENGGSGDRIRRGDGVGVDVQVARQIRSSI